MATLMFHRLVWWLPLSSIATLVGCGSGLPQTVPVSGQVTFDGQAPPAPGTVYFLPQEAGSGFPTHPATADFDKNGYFKAKTFEPADGLIPGKYTMHVECYQTPPNMEGKPVKSYVPQKYQSVSTSGFSIEIQPRMGRQEIKLDVVTK